MANVVKFYAVLRSQASWTTLSTQLSSSSRTTRGILQEHKLLEVRPTGTFRSASTRPCWSFSLRRGERGLCMGRYTGVEDHDQVLAERNRLRDQLAQTNDEIKKFQAVVHSAFKDLSKVVPSEEFPTFNEMEEDEKVKPITPERKKTLEHSRSSVW